MTDIAPGPNFPGGLNPPTRERWLRIGLQLVVATMAYNVLEAGIALLSGIAARSVALVGFGLDSVIETVAAAVLLWRLRLEARGADAEAIEHSEYRVRRLVGVTFLVLAAYVVGYAAWTLWARTRPDESLLGIGLAIVSLIVMPLISWGKIRAAHHVGSRALLAEAKETLACSYLSLTLLLGLAANTWLGWWWADPVAATLMVPWLVKEGIEGLHADEC